MVGLQVLGSTGIIYDHFGLFELLLLLYLIAKSGSDNRIMAEVDPEARSTESCTELAIEVSNRVTHKLSYFELVSHYIAARSPSFLD